MTQEEIQEGNELIAEFMGIHRQSYGGSLDLKFIWYTIDGILEIHQSKNEDGEFHFSWDWLMPVVEKIEGLGYGVSIEKRNCIIWNLKEEGGAVCGIVLESKKYSTYKAILDFIHWYNQQEK